VTLCLGRGLVFVLFTKGGRVEVSALYYSCSLVSDKETWSRKIKENRERFGLSPGK
jgi:hypothetical protein